LAENGHREFEILQTIARISGCAVGQWTNGHYNNVPSSDFIASKKCEDDQDV
jgi:hypothetical protein